MHTASFKKKKKNRNLWHTEKKNNQRHEPFYYFVFYYEKKIRTYYLFARSLRTFFNRAHIVSAPVSFQNFRTNSIFRAHIFHHQRRRRFARLLSYWIRESQFFFFFFYFHFLRRRRCRSKIPFFFFYIARIYIKIYTYTARRKPLTRRHRRRPYRMRVTSFTGR